MSKSVNTRTISKNDHDKRRKEAKTTRKEEAARNAKLRNEKKAASNEVYKQNGGHGIKVILFDKKANPKTTKKNTKPTTKRSTTKRSMTPKKVELCKEEDMADVRRNETTNINDKAKIAKTVYSSQPSKDQLDRWKKKHNRCDIEGIDAPRNSMSVSPNEGMTYRKKASGPKKEASKQTPKQTTKKTAGTTKTTSTKSSPGQKRYEIDEKTARMANNVNSFSDYKEGSATREYQNMTNAAFLKGEEQKKKVDPMYWDKIDRAVDRYYRNLATWQNKNNAIEASCPSFMIVGGGSAASARAFNSKKEKQNARRSKSWKDYENLEEQLRKIGSIGRGGISSNDPNALNKLSNKRENLEKEHQKMIRVNAYYRKTGKLDGCPDLNDNEIRTIESEMDRFRHKQPFAPYALTNSSAEIRRLKNREKTIEKVKSSELKEYEINGVRVVESPEKMRIQLYFDGKPDSGKIAELKSNGFRWSPKDKAWQRQLNNSGRYAASWVLEQSRER